MHAVEGGFKVSVSQVYSAGWWPASHESWQVWECVRVPVQVPWPSAFATLLASGILVHCPTAQTRFCEAEHELETTSPVLQEEVQLWHALLSSAAEKVLPTTQAAHTVSAEAVPSCVFP